ncbi:MAG: winged helix-turn-helix transcriptional regulator [Deltaproteobacteria bacterium]|nr:winged helix-turn-helix transcriptional regulator [Deltaproteobacteria bacterium]
MQRRRYLGTSELESEEAQESLAQRLVAGLGKVSLAMKSQAWQAAGPRGLSPTQAQVLMLLRVRHPRRLSQLAEELAVTAPTASDAVATLVRKGLVGKERELTDARAIAISLTAKGRREAERLADWPDFLLDAVADLEPSEQDLLLRVSIKLVRFLQLHGQISTSRMCATCRFFVPYAHDEAERPHHCAFTDAALAECELLFDCPDQEAAEPEHADRTWNRYVAGARVS